MKEGGYHGTPRHSDGKNGRSNRRYPASLPCEVGSVDSSTLPFQRLAAQPAASRAVVLPSRRPDCLPPSGRRRRKTAEQRLHEMWRHAMTRLMTLMAALSLTVLSIMLGAPRELWLDALF